MAGGAAGLSEVSWGLEGWGRAGVAQEQLDGGVFAGKAKENWSNHVGYHCSMCC